MANAISATVLAVCTAFSAIELVHLLDPQPDAGTALAAQAPPIGSAVRAFFSLAAVGCLCASLALTHRHLQHAGAAAAAGAGNRRLPDLVRFMLCTSAGFLHFFLFVLQAPGGVDRGAVRAIGLAALSFMPAVATATYFLGVLLIIVAHIRAGGEGGGGAVAGPIEAPVGLLSRIAMAATGALLCLMAMAVCFI